MTGLPFEVYVRHRGYRLPYPLHRWHLPEEREDHFPPEDFKPSEFDPVHLILRRLDRFEPITLSIEGTPFYVTLSGEEEYKELAAWTPPNEEQIENSEGLWGRAGVYRIRVLCGTEAWVTTIEVQPHYLSFEQMGRMCADIERMSTWVAYDILPYAPVFRSKIPKIAQSDGGEDDPAVQFALLKEAIPETLRTLRFLFASPHLAHKPTYVAVRSGGSSRQDRRSLRMEERLKQKDEDWSVQRSTDLTYDIYENRFVKRLLLELQRRLGQLQARLMDALYELERQEDEVRRRLRRQFGDQEERIRREEPLWTRPIRNRHSGLRSQVIACGRMRDSLATVMRADLLRDVPPLQGIVRPTNVLQHDPQYSRLWSIYRVLRLSDRGETSMAHRFHRRSRPSWELYEMWCAVQVMEACMRDLRFTQVLAQSVAEGNEEGIIFLYDTPRPAMIRLAHETEPLIIEVIYGGFIPMSEKALMAHPRAKPEKGDESKEPIEEEAASESASADHFNHLEDDSIAQPPVTELPKESGNDPVEEEEITLPEEEGLLFPYPEAPIPPELLPENNLLVTRGIHTAPDLQIRFFDGESEELLGVVILDSKYKGGRRVWGREGGRLTDDRMTLESYLMDIHRRDKEEAAMALFSQPADDIVLGAYALYPGERFGRDLPPEERRNPEGRLGAVRISPEGFPAEELTHLLLEAMAQAQVRRERTRTDDHGDAMQSDIGSLPDNLD
jgi:hypothetical protein